MEKPLLIFVTSLITFNLILVNYVSNQCEIFTAICVLIVSSVISWIIANRIYNVINKERVSTKNIAVLITGCDSGFGHNLAVECDKLGFTVFAGVLSPDGNGAQHLRDICSQKLKIVKMDVTSNKDVVNVVKQIQSSGQELWAVVNNAGIGLYAPMEWGEDVKQLTDMLNVNVLGLVRVSKLCLPLLRQSKGRLVSVSSMFGKYCSLLDLRL